MEINDYLLRTNQKLAELENRRKFLEKKAEMRAATMKELSKIHHDSKERTVQSLEKARQEALARHQQLRHDITQSLHQLRDVGAHNEAKLAKAKQQYQRKVEEYLPLWKRQQSTKLEAKIRDIQRERALVEERREQFIKESRREEKIKEAFEFERRLLVKSLVGEHDDRISAEVRNAKLLSEAQAIDDYAKKRMVESEYEYADMIRSSYDSESTRKKAEELLRIYQPPRPPPIDIHAPQVTQPEPVQRVPTPPSSAKNQAKSNQEVSPKAHNISFIKTLSSHSFHDQLSETVIDVKASTSPTAKATTPTDMKSSTGSLSQNQNTSTFISPDSSYQQDEFSYDLVPEDRPNIHESPAPSPSNAATSTNTLSPRNSAKHSPIATTIAVDPMAMETATSLIITPRSHLSSPKNASTASSSNNLSADLVNLTEGMKASDCLTIVKTLFQQIESENLSDIIDIYKSSASAQATKISMKSMKEVFLLASTPESDLQDFSLELLIQVILKIFAEYASEIFPM
jgi:hypothetical protein